MSRKPFLCGRCHKRFTTEDGACAHAATVHRKGETVIYLASRTVVADADDGHESVASAMIHARQNPDDRDYAWAREMLP